MKTPMKLIFLLLPVSIILTVSCKKRKLNRDTTASKDDATAEAMFNDVYKVMDENAASEPKLNGQKTGQYYYMASGCATVTLTPYDTSTYPKTMIIDFGNGCQGNDGKTRKGKIIVEFTGKYRQAGTVITITPDNYFVNDYKVEGKKIVENKGKNSSNHTYYTITVDGKVTRPDGKVITWKSNRVREWIEGESTTFWNSGISGIFDDKYKITGNGSGVASNGINYTVEITDLLIVQYCSYIPEIVQGKISLRPEDLKERVIDFGNGTCDNQATVTIGNKVYTFNLR